jgi:hypothetical protein
MVSCFAYYSTLNMEAVYSTDVKISLNYTRYNSEDHSGATSKQIFTKLPYQNTFT